MFRKFSGPIMAKSGSLPPGTVVLDLVLDKGSRGKEVEWLGPKRVRARGGWNGSN